MLNAKALRKLKKESGSFPVLQLSSAVLQRPKALRGVDPEDEAEDEAPPDSPVLRDTIEGNLLRQTMSNPQSPSGSRASPLLGLCTPDT